MPVTLRGHRRRLVREEGETLVEILIAVMLIATVVTALLSGMAAAVSGSSVHRKQAEAEAVAREAAERLKDRDPTSSVRYMVAANAGSYTLPQTDGYTTSVTSVLCWEPPALTSPPQNPYTDSGTFTAVCSESNDEGLQLVTVTVTSTEDSRVSETVQVIKRQLT